MDDRYNYIGELIVKDMQSNLTPDEKKELDNWIAASPDNQALYNLMKSKDGLQNEFRSYGIVKEAVNGATQKIEQFLAEQEPAPVHPMPRRTAYRWLYAAAAILLIIITGLLLTQFSHSKTSNDTIATIQPEFDSTTAPRGHLGKLALPDGSHIQLNAASTIYAPATFTGEKRRVQLKGEGYFDIKHASGIGKKMPFVVSIIMNGTNAGEVEVLGTRFNIDAYGDDKQTCKLTVLEGRVKVSNKTEYKIIDSGYSARWNKEGAIELTKEDQPAADTLWINHILSFSKTPIQHVFQRLERTYDVRVEYRNGYIPGCSFTGELHTPSGLPKVLNIINDQCACKATYDETEKKIIVQNPVLAPSMYQYNLHLLK